MRKCICIVDDQLTIRVMLRYALTLQGFDVVEAADGNDALEKILTHDIDMVIADWQMPEMDGLELLRRLRTLERFADRPFVMISCHDDVEARRKAQELGALNWLKKPFRISDFQMIVERGLSNADIHHDSSGKAADGSS